MDWDPADFSRIERSLAAAKSAKERGPSIKYRYDNLKDRKTFAEIEQLEGRAFLYLFELTAGDPGEVHRAMIEARKEKGAKLPRCPENLEKRDQRVLYLGSSQPKKIVTRLNQHVFGCSPSTYSLKLNTWFFKLKGVNASLSIQGYDGLSDDCRFVLEDAYAEALKPLFGKRGGNGW